MGLFHDFKASNFARVRLKLYLIPTPQGLAAPLVAQKLLGSTGEYAVLFLILMAVMSTGSVQYSTV